MEQDVLGKPVLFGWMNECPGVQDVFAEGPGMKVTDVRPGEIWAMGLVALPGRTKEKQSEMGRRESRE